MNAGFISHNSRKLGFFPQMFPTVEVKKNEESEYGWDVFSNGKQCRIRTPKEWTSKKQHYYAYVRMDIGGQYMLGRQMPLAALVWLRFIGKPIPPGYVVDHINEDPSNNDPGNLQLLKIGQNAAKSYKLRAQK